VLHYTKKDMIACFKQHINLNEGIVQGLKLLQRVLLLLDEGKGKSNKKLVKKPKTSKRAINKM
jgi:hypothetical protein